MPKMLRNPRTNQETKLPLREETWHHRDEGTWIKTRIPAAFLNEDQIKQLEAKLHKVSYPLGNTHQEEIMKLIGGQPNIGLSHAVKVQPSTEGGKPFHYVEVTSLFTEYQGVGEFGRGVVEDTLPKNHRTVVDAVQRILKNFVANLPKQ